MFQSSEIGKLTVGGLFSSAGEFDYAVRRYNQDNQKLLKLAKRNKSKIHHVCLLLVLFGIYKSSLEFSEMGGQKCPLTSKLVSTKTELDRSVLFKQECPFTDRSDLFFFQKTEVSFS